MKKLNVFLMVLITATTITACSPKISYLGNDVGESSNIMEYFGEVPQGKSYEVLGIATNKVDKGDLRQNKLEKLKAAMIKIAKKKGADAIVYTSLKRETVGSTGTINNGGLRIGNPENNTTFGSRINTRDEKKNVVEAKFIKFK